MRKRLDTTATLVPAAPGYNIIYLYLDDENNLDYQFDSVIAWRCETTRYLEYGYDIFETVVFPITNSGDPDDQTYATQSPDGRCEILGDRAYDSLDKMLIDYEEMAKANAKVADMAHQERQAQAHADTLEAIEALAKKRQAG